MSRIEGISNRTRITSKNKTLILTDFARLGMNEQECNNILRPILIRDDAVQVINKICWVYRAKESYALNNGKVFKLTISAVLGFFIVQNGYDFYKIGNKNIKLEWQSGTTGRANPHVMSLDSVYRELHYTNTNVVWASWASNAAKGIMSPTEYLALHSTSRRDEIARFRKLQEGVIRLGISLQ